MKSIMQAASDALGAYLQTALGSDVVVYTSWPNPDIKLPGQNKTGAVTIISTGPRQTEVDATGYAREVSRAELVPPDPILMSYTWDVALFRQNTQLDVWATSFVECDDLLARLDLALRAGTGATLGHANADPFRDGCLVKVDPADGYDSFAEFSFDGQDDNQTPAQSGRDEWRATMSGECAVNYTVTKTLPRLKTLRIRLKVKESGDPGETDVFTVNADGTYDHVVTVP